MVIATDGSLVDSDFYPASVCNRAKLAYDSVANWLEGIGPIHEAVSAVAGLDANLRLQDEIAQLLKCRRHERGTLDLQTIQARPVCEKETIVNLEIDEKDRA